MLGNPSGFSATTLALRIINPAMMFFHDPHDPIIVITGALCSSSSGRSSIFFIIVFFYIIHTNKLYLETKFSGHPTLSLRVKPLVDGYIIPIPYIYRITSAKLTSIRLQVHYGNKFSNLQFIIVLCFTSQVFGLLSSCALSFDFVLLPPLEGPGKF